MTTPTHTPGPWRLSEFYATRGYGKMAKTPSPNRWQGIFQPIPGQEYGSLSNVVGVGIDGQVDDYWLSIQEEG